MSLPGTYKIAAYEGDTLEQTFVFTDSGNLPIDLSDATFVMTVRKKVDDPVLWTAATGDGITVGGVDNNEVTVAKVMDVPPGSYVYDLQATFTGPPVRVKTYLYGTFNVTGEISE